MDTATPATVSGVLLADPADPYLERFVCLTADHDAEDYGLPCFICLYNNAIERLHATRQCRHRAWRRWWLTRRLASMAYSLGIVSGYGYTIVGDGHDMCVDSVHWRGERPYLLGVSRKTWRCWRSGHLRGEPVGLGFCGKCVPWQCCGSTAYGHADGCREAAS